jgi:hypothetical protein
MKELLHILKEQPELNKQLNLQTTCTYIIFFSYLDMFSLDNDSFDYRNVD